MKKSKTGTHTPTIKPVNQRILCVEVPAEEVTTESGLILPAHYTKAKKDGSRMLKPRFIVAAAAEDAVFNDSDGKPAMTLQEGDEVYPFWPEDVESFFFPTVFDYGISKAFVSLHASELAGFTRKRKEEKE